MDKFITDGNIKAKSLKRMLIRFWDNGINPISGQRVRTHVYNGVEWKSEPYVREGIDQRLYSHNRLMLNPSVFNLHLNYFNQKTMSSGEVIEKFKKRNMSNNG